MQAKTYCLNPRGNDGQLEVLKQGYNMMKSAVQEDYSYSLKLRNGWSKPSRSLPGPYSLITFIMFYMLVILLDYHFN